MDEVERRIRYTQGRLDRMSVSYGPANLNQRVALDAELARSSVSYEALLRSYQKIEVAEARSVDGIVYAEAQVGDGPVQPRPLFDMLMAAIAGLSLAAVVTILAEKTDYAVRRPKDVERAGLITFGVLGDLGSADSQAVLASLSVPNSPAGEGFRLLRANISFLRLDHPTKTVLVTGTGRGASITPLAAGLAWAFAQAGRSVTLVDANFRSPQLHRLFGLSNNRGLTAALRDSPGSARRYDLESGLADLRVMPSGPIPPNPSELLSSRRMAEVLRELGEAAEMLILVTPSLEAGSHAFLLAARCDAAVLAVSAGDTSPRLLIEAKSDLAHAGVTAIGVVLTDLAVSDVERYSDSNEGPGALTEAGLSAVGGALGRVGRFVAWSGRRPHFTTGANDADG
jgi:non-specific protein-tyrosine kinase